MKLQKPSIEVLLIGIDIFKRIETIGRVCVKSEDKITDASAMKFCRDRLKSGHTAIFNHGISYFRIKDFVKDKYIYRLKADFPHIKIQEDCTNIYIAVPFRCYLDFKLGVMYNNISWNKSTDSIKYNNILNDLFNRNPFSNISNDLININGSTYFNSISENTILKLCPEIVHISVKFTTDRGITHELVRHTIAAFMQESTRWCNYSKDKFSNNITYIKPFWIEDVESDDHMDGSVFRQALRRIEQIYLELIEYGWTAQQARSILPNILKSDIWVTATVKEWYGSITNVTIGDITYEERKGILEQRLHKTAHPQMIEVMNLVKLELDKMLYGS